MTDDRSNPAGGVHAGHETYLTPFATRMARSLTARSHASGLSSVFLPAEPLRAALAAVPPDAELVEVDTQDLRLVRALRSVDLELVLERLGRSSRR